MTWQFNIYALLLILSSILSGWLAVTVWRRRVVGSNSFTLLLLSLTIWSFAYGVELTQTDLATILWVIRIEYLGMIPLSVMWLVFVLQYVGLDKWVTRRNLILLFIIPVVVVLSNWTNSYHGLYYAEVGLTSSRGMIMFDRTPGVMYWVSVAFSYTANLIATLLLVRFFFQSSRPYRYQAGIALTAALIPWASNIIYNTGLSPLPSGLDISPLSFTLTSLIFAWGMFRFKLLDVVPVARSTLVNTMEDAWIVLDGKDRFVDLNPAAQRLWQQSAAEVIGRPAAEVLAGQPDLVARFRENRKMRAEISLGEDSDRQFYDIKLTPLTNRQGHVTGRLIVLRDITAYKEAVEAAEAANRAKTAFLTMMSHELRTPLNGILGYAQVLQRDPALGPKQRKQAATIEQSGEHLLLLINDVLDVAKVEAGKVELHETAFDLRLFLHQVCEIIQVRIENKGVAFRFEVGGGLPTAVYGDEKRLRQVLVNLLDNAAKFTDRGEVVLRVTGSRPPLVSLRVEVADTGVGIAPEDLETIFEPFERAGLDQYKRVGTGLGLSICRALVELMGGALQVASQPGQGSRFWFEIPLRVVTGWERGTAVTPLPPHHTPPYTDLTTLYELALQGDVAALREKIGVLAHADTRFVPSVVKLQEMLDTFQINEICSFLEAQLSSNSGDALKKHG